MSGLQAGITRMESLQEGLAATISQTSDEIAHIESLDTEQRSEVYAIIEAIRGNSQAHQTMVGQLAAKLRGAEGHA